MIRVTRASFTSPIISFLFILCPPSILFTLPITHPGSVMVCEQPLNNAFLCSQDRLARLCSSRSVSLILPSKFPPIMFTSKKVSQQHGSSLSRSPLLSGHTGRPFFTASRSPSLRSLSVLVRGQKPFGLLFFSRCLGMIWRMIPSNMPHSFCVVQTVIIALCFHVLTGVCGCFTWASYLTVFKPYRSIQASAS